MIYTNINTVFFTAVITTHIFQYLVRTENLDFKEGVKIDLNLHILTIRDYYIIVKFLLFCSSYVQSEWKS